MQVQTQVMSNMETVSRYCASVGCRRLTLCPSCLLLTQDMQNPASAANAHSTSLKSSYSPSGSLNPIVCKKLDGWRPQNSVSSGLEIALFSYFDRLTLMKAIFAGDIAFAQCPDPAIGWRFDKPRNLNPQSLVNCWDCPADSLCLTHEASLVQKKD